MRYEDSGVSISKAKRIGEAIAKRVQSTWNEGVLSRIGSFGGLFEPRSEIKEPVLVSSIDGVGTKLLVARKAGRFDTVGQDLVNHCVNDILVQGAKPLFFLDYIAAGNLDQQVVEAIVRGLAEACRQNRCVLLGGETAEMPDIYKGEDLDLAGCIVGIVEKNKIIDGKRIKAGDRIWALPSVGLHTNGYSLARKILFDRLNLSVDNFVEEFGCSVGEELLKVHPSYLDPVCKLMDMAEIRGMAHITGGGLVGNLPRILPKSCDAVINKGAWRVPPVFEFLQRRGEVDESEMYSVFNMGLGMLLVVPGEVERGLLLGSGETNLFLVGEVVKGKGRVIIS